MPRQIGIAADHGGFDLKQYLLGMLRAAGHTVVEFGDNHLDPDDDYPDFVVPLARAVACGEVLRGVAICGSGVGASIAANKVAGVRACLIHDTFSAHQGVEGIPEFYSRNEKGIPTAWVARMRESMARLTPQFSANRAVFEYTEQHYLPAALAGQSRLANNGAVGRQIEDWRHSLEQKWSTLHFGTVKVETRDGKHIIEVQVSLHGLDPKAVRVELYADGIQGSPPVRQEMTRLHPLPDESGGYVYSAAVAAARPSADYTVRVMPHCDGVAVPLEEGRIFWQR